MNPAKSRQIVVASMGSTLAIVVVAEAMAPDSNTKLSMKTLAGLGFGFLFLSVTADFAPQVAAPLSVLVLLTALVVPAPGQSKSAGALLLDAVNGRGVGQGTAGNPTIAAPGGANPDPQLVNPNGGGLAGPPRIGFTR